MKNIKSILAPLRRSVRCWLLERYWEACPSKAPQRAQSCLRSTSSGSSYSKDKNTRKVLKAAERQGCKVIVRNNNHLRVVAPDGRWVPASATPSDVNAYKQVRRDLLRIGVTV